MAAKKKPAKKRESAPKPAAEVEVMVARSAKTGRWVDMKYALRHPYVTVVERFKRLAE